MNNKYKPTPGIIAAIFLFILAVHFDFVGAAYQTLSASTQFLSQSASKSANKIKVKRAANKSKNISAATAKLKGIWRVTEVYSSPTSDGPFSKFTADKNTIFELTFRDDVYCDSRLKDPTDSTNAKPFCELISLRPDGSFTGSRLAAFGGFIRLNNSRIEFFEGGMSGYAKYVFDRKK